MCLMCLMNAVCAMCQQKNTLGKGRFLLPTVLLCKAGSHPKWSTGNTRKQLGRADAIGKGRKQHANQCGMPGRWCQGRGRRRATVNVTSSHSPHKKGKAKAKATCSKTTTEHWPEPWLDQSRRQGKVEVGGKAKSRPPSHQVRWRARIRSSGPNEAWKLLQVAGERQWVALQENSWSFIEWGGLVMKRGVSELAYVCRHLTSEFLNARGVPSQPCDD